MKKNELTKQQKEDIERFGANTWFVEYLYNQYQKNPSEIPDQWQKFFENITGAEKGNGQGSKPKYFPGSSEIALPVPDNDDEVQIIAGSSAKILDNMNASLSVPVATSQRSIPVKLLEENRIIINRQLQKNQEGKVSFTHLIT
jgi:2-oxoglutarate dehydrogenase E1 component